LSSAAEALEAASQGVAFESLRQQEKEATRKRASGNKELMVAEIVFGG